MEIVRFQNLKPVVVLLVGLFLIIELCIPQQYTDGPDENPSPDYSLINEIKGADLPKIFPFACVRTSNFEPNKINFILCGKPFDRDEVISKDIILGGAYEKDEVEVVLEGMANYPQATFLDLGANIGMFSVAAAASNFSVVAVDPVLENLGYVSESLELGGHQRNVRFLYNAVSGKRGPMFAVALDGTNEGGQEFASKEHANTNMEGVGTAVNSVLLSDILENIQSPSVIIKMDIEGHECNTLMKYLHSDKKDKWIPYILMEWILVVINRKNCCPQLKQLIQAFKKDGYYPVDTQTRRVIDDFRLVEKGAMQNIVWVHKSAVHLTQYTLQ